MGRHTSAATTSSSRRRSSAYTTLTSLPTSTSVLLAGVFLFSSSAFAAPQPAPESPPSSSAPLDTASAAATRDPHATISDLLASGDTLEAVDLLYENAGSDWADSLLDLVVLPADDPSPATTSGKPRPRILTRLAFRRVPSTAHDGFWASSAMAAWFLPAFWRAGIENALVPSVRIHDIESDLESYRALEPRLSWNGQRGIHRASLDLWGLVGTSNDAGLDATWESSPFAWGWMETEASLSLEAEQEAGLGIGSDGEKGAWSWTASIRTGWVRMIEPSAYSARMLEVDQIDTASRNGLPSLMNAILDGRNLNAEQTRAALASDGEEIESIDPDRLFVRAHLRALRGTVFRYGPGLDLEGRASTGSERWMPHLRERWASGTQFLRERGSGDVYALGSGSKRPSVNPTRPLVEATYVCVRVVPSLNGVWTSRDRTWDIDAFAAWNQVAASDPGHPLEDDRQGFEARLAFQRRW